MGEKGKGRKSILLSSNYGGAEEIWLTGQLLVLPECKALGLQI